MSDKATGINWIVSYTNKASKQRKKLPQRVQEILDLLIIEIEKCGPVRNNWSHFGSLKGKSLPENSYHCHIKSGRPTFVSCWNIVNKKLKQIEVFYVGTHEDASY